MASDIIQNWAFAEQKTVAATISKPTDIRLKKTTDLLCRPIKIQFQNFFSDIVYNVKNKIDFAKNRGAGPPGSAPVYCLILECFDFYPHLSSC